jgi:hypothetical protein
MTGPRPVLDSGLGAGQGIWEATETPILKVGTRGSLEDGRVFYYARSSGSLGLSAGNLLMAEVASAQNESLAVNTAAIGDRSVTVTFGTDTTSANDFVGGFMAVTSGTGRGVIHEISSHAPVTSGGEIELVLVDPIYVAFVGGTKVFVVKNRWMDVIHSVVSPSNVVLAGITQMFVPEGNTNPQYFWCQTWGISCAYQAVHSQQAVRVGHGATVGAVGYAPGPTPAIVGQTIINCGRFEMQPIYLQISQ